MSNQLVDQQRKLLSELADLVKQRAAGEVAIGREHQARDEHIIAEYKAQRKQLHDEFEREITALRSEYQKLREDTIHTYETTSYAVVQEEERFREEAKERYEKELDGAKRRYQVARRTANDEFEDVKDLPQKEFERTRRRCEKRRAELRDLLQGATKILRRRACAIPDGLPPAAELGNGDPMERYQVAYALAHQRLRELTRQPAAEFLERGWPFLIALFTFMGLAVPVSYWLKWNWAGGLTISAGVAIALYFAIRRAVRPRAREQTEAALPPLLQTIADGEAALDAAIEQAREKAEQKYQEYVERRDAALSEAHAQWSRARIDLADQYQTTLAKAEREFQARRKRLDETYRQDLKALDEKYPPLIEAREQKFTEDAQRLLEERQNKLEASRRQAEDQWRELVRRWSEGIKAFSEAIRQMNRICDQRLPAWREVACGNWSPPDEELPALRFGTLQFRLDMLEHGVPDRDELRVPCTEFSLPAALSYPECPSLVYLAEGEGRDLAIRSLQNVMLRLLTSLPPGKVRFTIIDPTGLGQNFSAFMHLADFDERLVASRIWTETVHINKRLVDLTEHMENVIQKYLRNEFESIQEYNRHAGEVAEPFQILVVANFPANFSEEAARRLVSIASSGARCGVYTLVAVDTKLKLPRNFDLADIQTHAATLRWDGSRFLLDADDLRDLPLALDMPPADDQFTEIVRTVGERAKDASRVEVPFASVVPDDDQWWSRDSRAEITVPLGRAGATNLQHMRLGKGTSQHVLISGKTGSGKSTLLHAIITTVSLYYSPDEIHFYLIDFKKGVEFKAYASLGLPHARVIAIESEREFGMSVLNRLDVELRRRGDLFRRHGVQDLKGYRDAHPDAVLPRILLIIDEFQEFFVKDDKIAQDASLVLDRLVRQGRAFGIHVLLGSQTLAGAYSLARSTLGQMAVRIALQCSETDAHLILSDDNTAARLLSRPGEAIYNDANGLFEGNHPFQVVWLPDYEREQYLERLAELARRRGLRLPAPIVFEGNVPADPAQNELLRACLDGSAPPPSRLAPRAWLGAAVAIKEPAAAVFRRQSGSNLLIVGQQEQMALGVLASSVISLAAESLAAPTGSTTSSASGAPARFVVLDGQRAESPTAGFWNRLAKQLPIELTVASPNGIAAPITEIAAEVQRRLDQRDDAAPPIFLLIYNLARFRELRKSDEFQFSFDAEETATGVDRQLNTILREGPNFGVHTLIWCDTYTNVNRWIDRQSMSDLTMRVLFQMSATDSANLMDSPEASRLGVHRAILYSEEQGAFEKFRPYGLPEPDWLAWVRERLAQRVERSGC